MIQAPTFSFLRKLAKNNDREWFHANKASYEEAKQNILQFTEQLIVEINKFDKAMGFTDPKKCLFRIARDTRFSHDKSPYKTNFGVIINSEGTTRSELSGYYMQIEPNNCFLSAGIYMAMPDTIKALRTAIDDDFEQFSAIITRKEFAKKAGELVRDEDALARVPRGFDKNSPAAEYLKLKHFYVMVSVADKDVCSDSFLKQAAEIYKLMYPFNEFMNKAIRNK